MFTTNFGIEIEMTGITREKAAESDIKRLLGVYYEQNVTTEQFEDFDGERWVIFGE